MWFYYRNFPLYIFFLFPISQFIRVCKLWFYLTVHENIHLTILLWASSKVLNHYRIDCSIILTTPREPKMVAMVFDTILIALYVIENSDDVWIFQPYKFYELAKEKNFGQHLPRLYPSNASIIPTYTQLRFRLWNTSRRTTIVFTLSSVMNLK